MCSLCTGLHGLISLLLQGMVVSWLHVSTRTFHWLLLLLGRLLANLWHGIVARSRLSIAPSARVPRGIAGGISSIGGCRGLVCMPACVCALTLAVASLSGGFSSALGSVPLCLFACSVKLSQHADPARGGLDRGSSMQGLADAPGCVHEGVERAHSTRWRG